MTVHWCGAGLSAIPGVRRLIKNEYDVVVWNRTVDKANAAVGDITNNISCLLYTSPSPRD